MGPGGLSDEHHHHPHRRRLPHRLIGQNKAALVVVGDGVGGESSDGEVEVSGGEGGRVGERDRKKAILFGVERAIISCKTEGGGVL